MSDIQTVTDSAATAASHPVTVQVFNQGAGIWGNVATGLITGLLTGGVALAGIWLTHHFTLQREKQKSEDTRKKELHYIAAELVFLLEQFAEGCARVATDDGARDPQDIMRATQTCPVIDLNVITGDWRSLGPGLMYAIRELPVLKEWSDREIAGMEESEGPPDYTRTIREKQYLYARLGLKAILQARRLRKMARLPGTRLDATKWSAQPVLWQVWRNERKRRAQEHILWQRNLAAHQLKMQQHYDSRRKQPGISGESQ